MKKLLLTIGLLRALLITWNTPATYAVDELVTATKLNQQVRDNLQHLYDALYKRATLWHDEAEIVLGGGMTIEIATSQFYTATWHQAPPANGDTFRQALTLSAGTYTLKVLGRTGPAMGMLDWYLDSELIATGMDMYAATLAYNVVKTFSNIVVPVSGRHVLEGVVNGRHSSSTNYLIYLTKYWFHQASD